MNELYYDFENRLFLLIIASYGALFLGCSPTVRNVLMLDMPANLWKSLLANLDLRLNRANRSKNARRLRGRLMLIILASLVVVFGVIVAFFSVNSKNGWVFELIILMWLLPISAATIPARIAQNMLQKRELAKFSQVVAQITDADLEEADGFAVIRILITYLAFALPRYVIAPAFWYLLFGIPALLLCRLLSCLSDLFPTTHLKNLSFAVSFHFWDRVMQAIPVRISLVILWLGLLFVPKASPIIAIKSLQNSAINTRNICTYFAAYGLRLSLGGTYAVDGYKRVEPWIGNGKARVDSTNLSRSIWWYWCCTCVWLLVITIAYLYSVS